MSKDKKTIIQILATKHNLPLQKIEQIVNHQFKFVEKIMKEGKFEMVRLPYFGKFSVNPNRVKHINKLKNESKK
jgi:nucleoid DNA-binding protein